MKRLLILLSVLITIISVKAQNTNPAIRAYTTMQEALNTKIDTGVRFSVSEKGMEGVFTMKRKPSGLFIDSIFTYNAVNNNIAIRDTSNIIGIKASWFGFVGDSITDNYAAFQRLTRFLSRRGGNADIYFDPGMYYIDTFKTGFNVDTVVIHDTIPIIADTLGGGGGDTTYTITNRTILDTVNSTISDIIFYKINNVSLNGNGATISVRGNFRRIATSQSGAYKFSSFSTICPLWFRESNNITVNDFILNGNVQQMTKDAGVVEGASYGLFVQGCKNVHIKNVTTKNFAADGFNINCSTLQPDGKRFSSSNVILDGCYSLNNARQGITIGNANNVTVQNSFVKGIGDSLGLYGAGHLPMDAVDIEPTFNLTVDSEYTRNIHFINCSFENNKGGAISSTLSNVRDIFVDKCYIDNRKTNAHYLVIMGVQNFQITGTTIDEGTGYIFPYWPTGGAKQSSKLEDNTVNSNSLGVLLSGNVNSMGILMNHNWFIGKHDSTLHTFFPYINGPATFTNNFIFLDSAMYGATNTALIQNALLVKNNNYMSDLDTTNDKHFTVSLTGTKNVEGEILPNNGKGNVRSPGATTLLPATKKVYVGESYEFNGDFLRQFTSLSYPDSAVYTTSAAETGMLLFKIPTAFSTGSWFWIDGIINTTGKGQVDFTVSARLGSNFTFSQPTINFKGGDSTLLQTKVYLLKDASNNPYVGFFDTTSSLPSKTTVQVTRYTTAGAFGSNLAGTMGAWTTALVTSTTGYTIVTTPVNTTSGDYTKLFNKPAFRAGLINSGNTVYSGESYKLQNDFARQITSVSYPDSAVYVNSVTETGTVLFKIPTAFSTGSWFTIDGVISTSNKGQVSFSVNGRLLSNFLFSQPTINFSGGDSTLLQTKVYLAKDASNNPYIGFFDTTSSLAGLTKIQLLRYSTSGAAGSSISGTNGIWTTALLTSLVGYTTTSITNTTSGDYTKLFNKPTITAQVNSDWNASSGAAQILNKPTIPAEMNIVGTNTTYARQISGALGSSTITENIPIDRITTSSTLIVNQLKIHAIWLPVDTVITGVKWYQFTAGSYTASSYNGVGLYSYNTTTGVATLVASSTNDGTTWTATAGWASKAFSSAYTATKGLYYIATLYSSSAATTTPAIGTCTNTAGTLVFSSDFTNGAKLVGIVSAQTSLPSTITVNSTTATTIQPYLSLYK